MLLHVSTLLTCILLILILRIRHKKALHYYSLVAVADIFAWCLMALFRQYMRPLDQNAEMFFISCYNTLIIGLSFLLFFIGYAYSKSGLKINPKIHLIFIIPFLCILLTWTNKFHHLVYLSYSESGGEFVQGPFAYIGSFLDYGFIIVGLFYLIRFSIKNSGFFSRQSILVIVGTIIPVAVDVVFFTNIFSIPKYFDVISFSFTVLCFLVAIFRYDLFTIVPVALQTVVDHISDSYLVLNEQMEITDFNQTFSETFQKITEIKRKVSIEKIFISKLTEHTAEIIEKLLSSVREHHPCSFEIHMLEEQFDKFFIVEITPVVSSGAVVCTIVLFKDVTEQKRNVELIAKTQLALIESEHLASLGQLVGGIAHNLKTPIMSISGGLEGLSDLIDEYEESIGDAGITPEDHHEIAGDMRVWIGKMKEYTSYMSDIISTVKGQAVQLTASTTDKFTLKELIKRVEILMNHELRRYGCMLDIKCGIDMNTELRGEVNSFVQVVNNLITNAIEAYDGQEGIIKFVVTKEDQMVQFEVKDEGSGISAEVKNKLFKEMITTKAKNGTGLGLYMSYSTITGRFSGKMWFTSELGAGTSFYIMVPSV